jgi:hypothetical protein
MGGCGAGSFGETAGGGCAGGAALATGAFAFVLAGGFSLGFKRTLRTRSAI